ncbi:hypothetical protein B0I33_107323 [Prauserella shujinwangii]|uniref:Tail assembly chaperone E/41/14-like protein n=1 Tax=Prauserella shujinwangii TaxID=1453103 RepID=A0A2T0LT09_9PSEU|nr:hypothetical protein [Prauserella shujinwangii]PRX46745.1 hypothetical protein B0I33_107323 [Prauserella shujinwangii]
MVDKELLFTNRLEEDELEIPGVGTVRFRALSRAEVLQIHNKEMPKEVMERKILVQAMVDPEMDVDDVKRWQAASNAGEIERVSRAIAALSGLEINPKEPT